MGLDAFQKAIDSGVDMVVMAEPPGFRPPHFEAAVKAGKHVFMEKPLATDAPGVRQVLAAGDEAKRKGLKVGVGLQRHHDPQLRRDRSSSFRTAPSASSSACALYWNGGPPAKTPGPRTGLTEMEYQLRNWYFFTWLSGDHIVEQHIHNIDVCNWLMTPIPSKPRAWAAGRSARARSRARSYDHHFVEFTYADGTKMFSQCRQIPGCWNSVSEHAHGHGGSADIAKAVVQPSGTKAPGNGPAAKGGARPAARQSIRTRSSTTCSSTPSATTSRTTRSSQAAMTTMTAILGRMATYSGKLVKWDEAFNSQLRWRRSGSPGTPSRGTCRTKTEAIPWRCRERAEPFEGAGE